MDDVDDLLYGNFEEAPLNDPLDYQDTKPLLTPQTPSIRVQQDKIPQTTISEEPVQQATSRVGLMDPNVSQKGKMFIGGLSWETTDQGLRNYMKAYGEVEDVLIMKDSVTNRSRGFGFLTFTKPSSIDLVLETEHYIDGKKIDPKRAVPKEEYERAEKVFVGGVHPDVSEKEFKDFFQKFGNVTEATIMLDRKTGRPRGFGFVTFASWTGVQTVLDAQSTRGIFLLGKRMEVKPASLRHQPLGVSYPLSGMIQPPMSGYGPPQAGRSYSHSPYNVSNHDTGSQDGSSERNGDKSLISNPDDDHESVKSMGNDNDFGIGHRRRENSYRNPYGGDRLQRERNVRYDRDDGHFDDRDFDDERYDRDRHDVGRNFHNGNDLRGRGRRR